jgi:hypothetical protein
VFRASKDEPTKACQDRLATGGVAAPSSFTLHESLATVVSFQQQCGRNSAVTVGPRGMRTRAANTKRLAPGLNRRGSH